MIGLDEQRRWPLDLEILAMALINQQRQWFALMQKERCGAEGDLEFGDRFCNDQRVYLKLVGLVEPQAYRQEPLRWVRAALEDAALADHWYTYEKSWE